jgi:hypothetical protein
VFIKFVIILLLLIVVVSLLTGRAAKSAPVPHRIRPRLRVLMLRVAVILLAISAAIVALHVYG